VCNKSDEMLNLAISNADRLYWEIDTPNPNPPKHKKIKVDGKSVTDSMSMVMMAVSSIQTRQTSAQCTNAMATTPPTKNASILDTQMVAYQVSTITQLTKQVSILQLAHNKINSKLDKLAEYITSVSLSVCTQQS